VIQHRPRPLGYLAIATSDTEPWTYFGPFRSKRKADAVQRRLDAGHIPPTVQRYTPRDSGKTYEPCPKCRRTVPVRDGRYAPHSGCDPWAETPGSHPGRTHAQRERDRYDDQPRDFA
jgi:hypothetical protein